MGYSDVYCFICGIKCTEEDIGEYDEPLLDELEEYIAKGSFPISKNKIKVISPKLLKNYITYIKNVKKIYNKLKWLSDIIIITKDKIISRENIEFRGLSLSSKTSHIDKHGHESYDYEYEIFKSSWPKSHKLNLIPGLICHKSCYCLLYKKFKIKFNLDYFAPFLHEYSLLNNYGTTINKYVELQDFILHNYLNNMDNYTSLEDSLLKNKEFKINIKNLNYLLNPLNNKENATRIIKLWIPKIKNKSKKSIPKKSILKKLRPSPSDSATKYKVGEKKKGNDGNMYIIVKNKNGVKRWEKFK